MTGSSRRYLNRCVAVAALLALILISGCSTSKPPDAGDAPVTTPGKDPAGPAGGQPDVVDLRPVTAARELLPAEDLSMTFTYQDGTQSEELLLAAENRTVQAKGDKAFLQWTVREDGVWRPDLTGFDRRTLLLFLPAKLTDGLTWEQTTDDDVIGFRLTAQAQCGSTTLRLTNCWRVEVINRFAVTLYDLAPGLGVVRAESQHQDAADSYEKVLSKWGPARLDTAVRNRLLDQGQTLHDREPKPDRVQRMTTDFQENVQWRRSIPSCGTPATGKPVLAGARGQVAFLCAGKLWRMDLATGQQTRLYAPGVPVADFAMEPNGHGFAVSIPLGQRGEVRYFERDSAKARVLYTEESWEVGLPLAWSPDGDTLVINKGTSTSRTYVFIDRTTGGILGETTGRGLLWSPDGSRYATAQGVYIPNDGVEGGSSRTLVVGEIRNGQRSERTLAKGTVQAGYEPMYFAADGTLVYRQFVPKREGQDSYWALAPTAGAEPVSLDVSSPLLTERHDVRPPIDIKVDGKPALWLGDSPDGRWSIFIFDNYGEVYLIASTLTGSYIRLPGAYHEWVKP